MRSSEATLPLGETLKEVAALGWWEEIGGAPDGAPQTFDSSLGRLSQHHFGNPLFTIHPDRKPL
jgi:hypothetical protein